MRMTQIDEHILRVIPAKAGIQDPHIKQFQSPLDSRFRGNDTVEHLDIREHSA